MGFSVSGATALLLVAFLIAFGTFYTASVTTFEQVEEAQIDQVDRAVDSLNSGISVTAYYDAEAEQLVVEATNEGATALELNETTLLVDGEFVADWQAGATVDGAADRKLWHPQEQLVINVDSETEPKRVKLVTEHGVSTAKVVEDDIDGLKLVAEPDTANEPAVHNWTWDSVDIDCDRADCIDEIVLDYEDITLDDTEIDADEDINYTVEATPDVDILGVEADGTELVIDVSQTPANDPSNGFFLEIDGTTATGIINPGPGEYEAIITFVPDDDTAEAAFGRTTYEILEE